MDGPRKNGKCCEDIGMNGHHEKWNTHPTRRTERLRQLGTDPAALRPSHIQQRGNAWVNQRAEEKKGKQMGKSGTTARKHGRLPEMTKR